MSVSLFSRDHLGKRYSFKKSGLTGGYYLTGNPKGRPVIILHGLTGSHIGMLPIAAHLSEYLCVLPDLPGHGFSPIPAQNATLQDLAKWFLEFTRHWPGAVVIAHSYGGTLAALSFNREPELVLGCILLNPVVETSRLAFVYKQFARMLRPGISAVLNDVGAVRRKRHLYLLERHEPHVLRIMSQLNVAESVLKTSNEQMQFFQKLGQHFDNLAIFKGIAKGLAAKTYCVVATNDNLVSKNNTRFLESTFGKRHIYKCKNSGHLMPIEAIDDTARIVKKILKRITKPAPRFKIGLARRPKA